MEEQTEVRKDPRTIFSALLNLQSETYEFILRAMAMDEWLKRAYTMMQERPEWSAERTYEAWRHTFTHVYANLFAMFFRPYRIMMFPLNPFSRDKFESITASSPTSMYLDFFNMWGEAHSRMLKGLASAFENFGNGNGTAFAKVGEPLDPESRELSPIGLMKHIADEQSRTYLETIDTFMQYVGGSQFLLPKEFFAYMQQLISSYPKAYQAGERYEAMLRSTWDKSLKRLAVEIKKAPEEKIEFKDFFESYIAIFGEEYDRMLRTPEFTELQGNLVAIISDTIMASEKMMEAQLEMFPALPFAPRNEVDTLAQRVHTYKRRINQLEHRVRELERSSAPAREELESLVRKIFEVELELDTLQSETRSNRQPKGRRRTAKTSKAQPKEKQ